MTYIMACPHAKKHNTSTLSRYLYRYLHEDGTLKQNIPAPPSLHQPIYKELLLFKDNIFQSFLLLNVGKTLIYTKSVG